MFPLDLCDASLILAITAMILLTLSIMFSPYYGKVNILINKKRLKNASLAFSVLFLITVAIRIITIIFML